MSKFYPDAKEDIGNYLEPRGSEIASSIWFDSAHAYDKKTYKSITGLISMLDRTPIKWSSTRQGVIESSTYGAEFIAGKVATE